MSQEKQLVPSSTEFTASRLNIPNLTPGFLVPGVARAPQLKTQLIEHLRVHQSLLQFNEPMGEEEQQSFSADVKRRGVIVPIQVDQFGQIVDGVHRYQEALRQGIKDVPTQIFDFVSDEARELHILKANWMRKTVSTRHKYISIALISKIYERGRGGDRSKSKEVSDTALPDVLELTATELGISPDLVKKARRYEREIKKHPRFEGIEPTKFLIRILPLLDLKNEYLRESLIDLAKNKNLNVSEGRIKDLILYDRLIRTKADKEKLKKEAANYVIGNVETSQGIDMAILRDKLGLPIKEQANLNEQTDESSSETEIDDSTEPQVEPSEENIEANDKFDDAVERIDSRKQAIEKGISGLKSNLSQITQYSTDNGVSVSALIRHSKSLNDFLAWLPTLPQKLGDMENEFLESGHQGTVDDPLDAYPPYENGIEGADSTGSRP